jgi:hypothetical protein
MSLMGQKGDPFEELVDVSYVAEEFLCPSCNLHLDNRDAIEAAGLNVDHIETETRQREYEPDYLILSERGPQN